MAVIQDPTVPTQAAAVKAASTAPAATDPALVVAISPNTAAQPANLTQVNGAAVVAAAAGIQKVGISGNAGASLDAVAGAAAPANAVYVGGRVATSNPANESNGDIAPVMTDKAGRVVITQVHIRELVNSTQTAIAATGETTIVAAGGANVFRDLLGLVITTAGAAAQTITIRAGTAGTTKFVLNYPNAAVAPGQPLILTFNPPLPALAANATWTAQQSAATACNYTAIWCDNL